MYLCICMYMNWFSNIVAAHALILCTSLVLEVNTSQRHRWSSNAIDRPTDPNTCYTSHPLPHTYNHALSNSFNKNTIHICVCVCKCVGIDRSEQISKNSTLAPTQMKTATTIEKVEAAAEEEETYEAKKECCVYNKCKSSPIIKLYEAARSTPSEMRASERARALCTLSFDCHPQVPQSTHTQPSYAHIHTLTHSRTHLDSIIHSPQLSR